jgi:hypothetical protein
MSEVGAKPAQLLSGLFVFVQADGCAKNEGFAVGFGQPVGLLPARKRVLDVTDPDPCSFDLPTRSKILRS